MDINFHRINRSTFRCKIYTALCILLNVSLAYLAYRVGMPVYLDTIGTIVMSSLGGFMPGLMVAVVTNTLCTIFNPNALYYTLINVLVALMTAWFVREGGFKKKPNPVIYFFVILLVSGLYGGSVQWLLLGGPQFTSAIDVARRINIRTGIGYFPATLIVNIGLNTFDKAMTSLIGLFIVRMIPEKERKAIWESNWRQKPIEGGKSYARTGIGKRSIIQNKIGCLLIAASLMLMGVLVWVSISVFHFNNKRQYTRNAQSVAKFAASVVDGDMVDVYLKKGEKTPGYKETEDTLYMIRESSTGIKYLYVEKILEDKTIFVFDLDTEDSAGFNPGDESEVGNAFKPYIPNLLNGNPIAPIESNETFGWLITATYPIKDSSGHTVAYAGADVSMEYISDYIKDFLLKSLLVFTAFFVLFLGYAIWASGYYVVYPISSMTKYVRDFIKSERDQVSLDSNVKKMRELDVHTGDDVEELYKAICEMEANMAEQMRELRHYSDATTKMQNGLIITMADMVENRDSDTAAHIQKTAAYARIITEGLLKNGYYAEKITPQFITDVTTSAPLHDIGKISIPDAILNKPGKLTADEFEIMKTHATAGMKIMEKAISTTHGESYLKEARNMAAYHHERWDGKGYPEGLHGQVIPLSARIMAVADVFDALVSERVYKPAFSFEKAVEIIKEGSGTQFDPKCVEVFIKELPQIRAVQKTYQGM